MDRLSVAAEASQGTSGSVATLSSFGAMADLGAHSLFTPSRRRAPQAPRSQFMMPRTDVYPEFPEGMTGDWNNNDWTMPTPRSSRNAASMPSPAARPPNASHCTRDPLFEDSPASATRRPTRSSSSVQVDCSSLELRRRMSSRARRPPSFIDPSATQSHHATSQSASHKRKAPPESPKDSPLLNRAPGRLKTDPDEEDDSKKAAVDCESNCCICMTQPEPGDLASINGCKHNFCFGCIEQWADRENTCPLCKRRFLKIERVHKSKNKGLSSKTSKKVKNRSQRTEVMHSMALESLFGELSRSGIALESLFSNLGPSSRYAHLSRIGVVFNRINGAGGDFESRASVGGITGIPATRVVPRMTAGDLYPVPSHVHTRASTLSAFLASDVAARPAAASMRNRSPTFSSDEDYNFLSADSGFPWFVSEMRSMHDPSRQHRRSNATNEFFAEPPLSPPRSFASNMNDVDAGNNAETPLEIEDSDEDVEDEVEIVGVSTPTRATRRSGRM